MRRLGWVILHAETEFVPALDPSEGEALAVGLGIKVAANLNFLDVIVEGDSSAVIEAFPDCSVPLPWRLENVILNVRHLASRFRSWTWHFVLQNGLKLQSPHELSLLYLWV